MSEPSAATLKARLSHANPLPSTPGTQQVQLIFHEVEVPQPPAGTARVKLACPTCHKEIEVEVASPALVRRRRITRVVIVAACAVFAIAFLRPGSYSGAQGLLVLVAFIAAIVAFVNVFVIFASDAKLALTKLTSLDPRTGGWDNHEVQGT